MLLEKENKKTDYAIIIPQSALEFVLGLIVHDNPSLEESVKEILKAYSV